MFFAIALASLAALLVGLLSFYAVMAPRWHEAQALNRRFKALAPKAEAALGDTIQQRKVLSDVPTLDALLKKIPILHKLEKIRQQANSPWPLGTWILLSAVLGGVIHVLLTMVWHPSAPYVLLGTSLGLASPLVVLLYLKNRRLARFHAQLPDALDTIARALRAGHSLHVGMQMVGEEFSDPVGTEFSKTIIQVTQGGISFTDALKTLPERIDSLEAKYFITSVIIQREAGGNLTEVLESIADLIRKRFELQDRIRALSAEGRFSAWFLFIFPFVLAGIIYFLNPAYISLLYTHPWGNAMVGVGLVMMLIGIAVTKKMITIKV